MIHQCTYEIDKGELIFKCPHCPDYEMRINMNTGKMEGKGSVEGVQHKGMVINPIFSEIKEN